MTAKFEVVATQGRARAGIFHTAHGPLATPVFAPVGTAGTVKAVFPRDEVRRQYSVCQPTLHRENRAGRAILLRLCKEENHV